MKIQNIVLFAFVGVVSVSALTFAITRPTAPKTPIPARDPTESEQLSSRFTNSVNWDSFLLKTTAEIKGSLLSEKKVLIMDCTLDDVDFKGNLALAVFDSATAKFTLAIKPEVGSRLIKSGRFSKWAVASLITELKRTPWEDEMGISKLRGEGVCVDLLPIAPGLMGQY